jgi:uncharacterized protein (TIGR00661 family)
MKILYSVQATGNGHISRACEVIPELRKIGEIDIFLSGSNANLQFPFETKYKSRGLSLFYGNNGKLDYRRMLSENSAPRLFNEIRNFPVAQYDLVINDFESISAWAAKLRGVPCVAFSHQAAFLSPHTPRSDKKSVFAELLLQKYAPAADAIGFHFKRYDSFIYTPVFRNRIRTITPENKGHYTVYLPAIGSDMLLKELNALNDVNWEVFQPGCKSESRSGNVLFRPVDADSFIQSLAHCEGVLCGAGFETPAEALFLGKKLFVIPIQGQYEQHCNAAALAEMGVTVAHQFNAEIGKKLQTWLNSAMPERIDYADQTAELVEMIATRYQAFAKRA